MTAPVNNPDSKLPIYSHINAILLGCLLLITTIIYWPGLTGGFLFDDQQNITENPKVLINNYSLQQLKQATLSGTSVPLKRPIPMISFALDHVEKGLDPFNFKLTNLLIHLLTGVSVFYLAAAVFTACCRKEETDFSPKTHWFALAVASIWLLHPLNLSPALYIVQRMASLAALFMFWGLYFYVRGRLLQISGATGTYHILVGLLLFGCLALFSKENAVLLPSLMLVIEWCIFRFDAATERDRLFVRTFSFATAVIPTIGVILYFLFDPSWILNSYSNRDFTLEQRLLTEARILWFYLRLFFIPDITQMGIFHDDIALSTDIFNPKSTLPAILGLGTLGATAFLLRNRNPFISLGLLFFFVGHLLESTVLSLELVHEHRNYLPSFGLALIVTSFGANFLHNQRMRWAVGISVIAILTLLTSTRANLWGDDVQFALSNARHHPNSVRSNIYAGQVFYILGESNLGNDSDKYFNQARHYFERARELDDHNLSGYFSLLILNDRQGHSIDQELVSALSHLLKTQPISAASVNALISAHQCEQSGECGFPQHVMNNLFRSILQNQKLNGWYAVLVLTEAGQRALTQGDIGAAKFFLRKASEINPLDAQVRLNYANILITLGDYVEAEKQIRQAEVANNDGYFDTRISDQWNLLLKARSR